MKNIMAMLVLLAICTALFGCIKAEPAEELPATTESSVQEELPEQKITDPEVLLAARWIETCEVKNGERYELEEGTGDVIELTYDGRVVENGRNVGVWVLMGEYLMTLAHSHRSELCLLSLTEEEMCLAYDGYDDTYAVFTCLERSVHKESKETYEGNQLVGTWCAVDDPEHRMQFNRDGSAYETSGDGDGSYTWFIANGNRLCLCYGDEMAFCLIEQCDDELTLYRPYGLNESRLTLIRAGGNVG